MIYQYDLPIYNDLPVIIITVWKYRYSLLFAIIGAGK